MSHCGMSYVEAGRAYEAMVSVIEDGIVQGHRIGIGKVGAIDPVWHGPRDVKMGFERQDGGKVVKSSRVFHLDGRYKFRFRLFRRFIESRNLRWVMDSDAFPDLEDHEGS